MPPVNTLTWLGLTWVGLAWLGVIGSCALLELGAETGVAERENDAVLYDGEMNKGRRGVLWVSPQQYIFSLLLFIFNKRDYFVSNSVYHNINTRQKNYLHFHTCY
jgi:hypothetical protein